MVVFASLVTPNLEDQGIKALSRPANRSILRGNIRTLVEVIRVRENFLRFLKTDPPPEVLPQSLAVAGIGILREEAEALYFCSAVSSSRTSWL